VGDGLASGSAEVYHRRERGSGSSVTRSTPASAPASGGGIVAGRWRLIERLGVGGMGEAWLACAVDGTEPVVLKRVRPHLLAQPLFAQQLAHEARLLERLRHPNIVALLEVAADGSHLVMEHV